MTNTVAEGGAKHMQTKTDKIKHYRRVIRSLRNKHVKTQRAILRKKKQLKYFTGRLRDLTRRSKPSSLRRKTLRIATATMPRELTQKYAAPRILNIKPTLPAGTAILPSVSPVSTSSVIEPSENLSPISQSSTQSIGSVVSPPFSPDTGSTVLSLDDIMENNVTPASVSSVRTDTSISPLSPQAPAVVEAAAPEMNAQPVYDESSQTMASLHLSDLNTSPVSAGPSSAATTKESTA